MKLNSKRPQISAPSEAESSKNFLENINNIGLVD